MPIPKDWNGTFHLVTESVKDAPDYLYTRTTGISRVTSTHHQPWYDDRPNRDGISGTWLYGTRYIRNNIIPRHSFTVALGLPEELMKESVSSDITCTILAEVDE